MKKKVFFGLSIFLFLLLFSTVTSAVSPFLDDAVQQNDEATGLTIIYPKTNVYEKGVNLTLMFAVFNSSNIVVNSTQVICSIHLHNRSNVHVLSGSLSPHDNLFEYVLPSNVMDSISYYNYNVMCMPNSTGSQVEYGYMSTSFEVTVDGEHKTYDDPSMLIAIILIPLIFAFLILKWAGDLNEEHNGFKIILGMFSNIFFFVSMHFAMIGVVKFYYFPELQGAISYTIQWMGWMYFTIFSYWLIYFIWKSIERARDSKEAELKY